MRAARRVCGAVAAFAGVAIVASLVGERGALAGADQAAFAAVRARRCRPGVAAARGISALAEPGVAYPATVLAGIVASRRMGWPRACVPLLVVAGGALVRRRVRVHGKPPRSPRPLYVGCLRRRGPDDYLAAMEETPEEAATVSSPVSRGSRGRLITSVRSGTVECWQAMKPA